MASWTTACHWRLQELSGSYKSIQRSRAHVLHAKVMSLLKKGAVETVPPAPSESGFYSRYFLVPKKDGGLSSTCAHWEQRTCRANWTWEQKCNLRAMSTQTGSGNMGIFSRPEVDIFASEDNTHCQIYFSKDSDALAHDWPNLLLYAFPPIALIPQVIRRIREQKHRLLLVAPLWRNQLWFSELARLLTAALWPIPLRQDLSQANGMIWHPHPDLWALHLWPLDGSLQSSLRMC